MNEMTAVESDVTGMIRIDPETAQPTYIAFGDVCRVNSDGSIEINPRYEPTEAAAGFWNAVRELAPNMINSTAIAIRRLEGLTGVAWYIAKGRTQHTQALYETGVTTLSGDGLAHNTGFLAVAQHDQIDVAVDRAVLAYNSGHKAHEKDRTYVVWSNEHRAWWKPARCGYVTSLAGAGLYTRDDALAIVSAATLAHDWTGWMPPNEVCICIDDLPEQARALLQKPMAEG